MGKRKRISDQTEIEHPLSCSPSSGTFSFLLFWRYQAFLAYWNERAKRIKTLFSYLKRFYWRAPEKTWYFHLIGPILFRLGFTFLICLHIHLFFLKTKGVKLAIGFLVMWCWLSPIFSRLVGFRGFGNPFLFASFAALLFLFSLSFYFTCFHFLINVLFFLLVREF